MTRVAWTDALSFAVGAVTGEERWGFATGEVAVAGTGVREGGRCRRLSFRHPICEPSAADAHRLAATSAVRRGRTVRREDALIDQPGGARWGGWSKPVYPFIILAVVVAIAIIGAIVLFA